ncbi:MAG TPA: inositol monophosphatase family protein [Solirubrobacter sp.]|nr:inositol monophosphatase family protein [Solirubrobacter sp.]
MDTPRIFPGTPNPQSDLDVAIGAAKAAFATATDVRAAAPLRPRAKSVAADLVTDADAAAEAAAAEHLRRHRPDDAIEGEEGTNRPGRNARRWLIDAVDGTVAFAAGIPSWCSAVVLTDEHGPVATAVYDGAQLHAAARHHRRRPPRPAKPLGEAHVAAFFRQDRLVLPGVRETARRLLDEAGLLRHAGPGTLELAWVADGRLDAWIQPATDPWDWLPGALLVTQAGGKAITVQRQTRWHIAGPAALVEQLEALVV